MAVVEPSLFEELHGFSVAGLTIDAAHEKINTTILRYEKYIRSLKAIHNSLVPVSRLPNEVLSRIMDLSYRSCTEFSPPPLRALLHLTWVCRHWRNVALGDAQLWRYIDNYSFPYKSCALVANHLYAYLTRSKTLSLDVRLLHLKQGLTDEPFDLCMTQLPRVRSLSWQPYHRLKRSNVELTKRFYTYWTNPAPQLTYLELFDTVLWSHPFNRVHPVLKEIKLVRCGFNWDWLLSISTLTSLRITFSAELIPTDVLLSKLIMLPSLTKLHIRSCLTKMTTPVTTPFVFPSLSRLYIEDDENLVFGFLEIIETPMISSLQASIHVESCREEKLTRALDLFKKLHPSLWNDNIRHLTIRPLSLEVEGSSPDHKDTISLCPPSRGSTLPLRSHHLFFGGVERLSLDIDYHMELFAIVKEQELTSVRSLWIDSHGSVLRFLAEAQKDITRNGSKNVFLPSLVEVHCRSDSFLLSFLEHRRKMLDRRLPKLTLSDHCPASDDREKYEGVADVVDVTDTGNVELLDVDQEYEWERE